MYIWINCTLLKCNIKERIHSEVETIIFFRFRWSLEKMLYLCKLSICTYFLQLMQIKIYLKITFSSLLSLINLRNYLFCKWNEEMSAKLNLALKISDDPMNQQKSMIHGKCQFLTNSIFYWSINCKFLRDFHQNR